MNMITVNIKIMGDKNEREVEIPEKYTTSNLYNVTSDLLTLPINSFKILLNGRPVKSDSTCLKEAGIKDDDKLNVMITEKISLESLNNYEKYIYNISKEDDTKKKQMAVLRLRKVMEKFVNRCSLNDLERVMTSRECTQLDRMTLSEEQIMKVIN